MINVRAGDMLGAVFFRKREEISSGQLPCAGIFLTPLSRLSSIFLTPLFCITSGGASGFRLFPIAACCCSLPWRRLMQTGRSGSLPCHKLLSR